MTNRSAQTFGQSQEYNQPMSLHFKMWVTSLIVLLLAALGSFIFASAETGPTLGGTLFLLAFLDFVLGVIGLVLRRRPQNS